MLIYAEITAVKPCQSYCRVVADSLGAELENQLAAGLSVTPRHLLPKTYCLFGEMLGLDSLDRLVRSNHYFTNTSG